MVSSQPINRAPRRVTNERPIVIAFILDQKAAVLQYILSLWQSKQLYFFKLNFGKQKLRQCKVFEYLLWLFGYFVFGATRRYELANLAAQVSLKWATIANISGCY